MPKNKRLIDLTGQRFGKLTVIKAAGTNIHKKRLWECVCDCGKHTTVTGSDLRNGHTKTCGCAWHKENAAVFHDAFVEMRTSKGEPFLIDAEDYERVKNVCWYINHGYVLGCINGKEVRLHRFLTECPETAIVDHINQNKADNRKCNLRIVNHSQNNMNKSMQKNNTSGYVGVNYHKKNRKWTASISVNRHQIYLGSFDMIQDAIEARKKAEERYFGAFSFSESQAVAI